MQQNGNEQKKGRNYAHEPVIPDSVTGKIVGKNDVDKLHDKNAKRTTKRNVFGHQCQNTE